ncbi:MAG TPA: hypothetical protein VH744_04740 [Terriglobales bacterium]
MRKSIYIALCILVFASLAMAQTYAGGATGITGVDKLGAHQNGGRGCVGCHAPHSGARGNGGNAATGGGPVTDPNTGNFALWGQDLGPLYNQTLGFGDEGEFEITLPADSASNENLTTGVMMCLSCHDGNIAKGAMMTNQSWEKNMGLLPSSYGPNPIPTLLGADGTANGNYHNDHPIGPLASLGALGLTSGATPKVLLAPGACTSHGTPVDCIQVNPASTSYVLFAQHYGTFNVTSGLVLPTSTAADAYVVCTTCHTPHSMYTFNASSSKPVAGNTSGTYPTYFFLSAPYNPGVTVNYNEASSATQFCRQCHFSGAGGSNENSGINGVTTKF